MARFGAVLDACVLVPVVLTDTMLSIADLGLFQPMWSDLILDETLRALKAIHPDKNPLAFEARVASMRMAFPEANISGWQMLEKGIADIWPDPNDAHVVAAAVRGRAEVIVTSNLKDFPNHLLGELGLHAVSPDQFLLDLWDLDKEVVSIAIDNQSLKTQNPALSRQEILRSLSGLAPTFTQINF